MFIYHKIRLLQGMIYRRICRVLPVQMNIVNKMNIFLDSKYAIFHFAEIFASRTYYPAIELFKNPPRGVLDLGACEGLFTLLVESHMRQRFHAAKVKYSLYEANRQLITKIKDNLRFAGLFDGVHIYCGAVGERSGEVDFKICRELHCSGIRPSGQVVRVLRAPYLDVEKNLSAGRLPVPELIKIDIEGSEVDFFENYIDFISKTCVVVVEFHQAGTSLDRWHAIVSKSNLQLYEVTAQSGPTRCEIFVNYANLNRHNLCLSSR